MTKQGKIQEGPSKTEQIMFRLRPAQPEAVRDWARARRIKLQPMIQLALEELMAAGMPAERYVKSSKKVHAAVKKVVSKETQSTYNLHIVELDEWVDWVIMVLDNPIDTYAIEALADNIIGFLPRSRDARIECSRQD